MRLKRGNVERLATSEVQIAKLKKEGYKEVAGPEAAVRAENAPEEEKPLEERETKDLRSLARDKGIEGYNSLSKEELLEALKDVV